MNLPHGLRAFRHRSFRIFFLGQGVSQFGTWLQLIATSWLIYRLTGSAFLLGLATFALQLPFLVLAPVAGVWVDRLPKRKVLLATNAIACAQATVMLALVATGSIEPWHLIAGNAVLGLVNAFDMPARQALLVRMVGKEDLGNAIALNSSIFNGARIVGPAIEGVVVGLWGEGACFAVNAASYLPVIAGFLAMKLPPQPEGDRGVSAWSHLKDGLAYAWSARHARWLLILIAKMLGESRRRAITNNDLLFAGILTAVPLLLIARQPDLGTAVTLIPILITITYVAGMPVRYLGILALVAALAAPVAYQFGLQDYQRERISTFLDPEQDPRGAGYQQIQGRITVGSGGVWGKGFMEGTQGQLRFLPVAHNDFIFSVLAEEQGFAGVLDALGLYLFVILRSIEAARLAKDRLGAYLVLGVLASFTFQVVYNITMSAGLVPVKGLTLPLMSYGGSSMIATLAGFGLILNVRMRRFTN